MVRRLSILFTLAALLGACGGAPVAQPTAVPALAPSPLAATPAPTEAAIFPLTIEHKYGVTEIPAAPQRVIALGYSEVDPILALGVVPVAVRDWFGDQPNAVWPWSQAALGGATPTVLNMPFGELNFETIAALNPDLIVATHSGITDAEYATLAQIAPTLAQTADYPDFGMPWQEQTKLIGRALGRAEAAEQLVAAVEERIVAARAANPQLQGKTIAWASPAEGDTFWVVGPNTPPLRFLTGLGLQYPAVVAEFVGDLDSQQLSSERLDLIDTDILISYVGSPDARAQLEANAVFTSLKAYTEGRVLIFAGDDPIYGALSYSTVASLPYLLDRLVPLLNTAVAGNPPRATGPITISHARGETILNTPARRVIALEWTYVENLLALGVQPIGVADIEGYNNWVRIPVQLGSEVVDVGTRQEPNLERIATLKPDLIIAPSFRIDANYAALNAIAPTLAFDPYPVDESISQYDEMIQTFQQIARVVGREDEGAQVLARMEQTFAGYATEIAAAGKADAPFALAQAFSGGSGAQVRLFTTNAMAVQITERLGLRNVWQDATFQQYGFSTVSIEALPQLGEAHFFYVVQDDDDVFASEAALPLWQALPFVKAGNAHPLGGDTWLFGGPLSAEVLAEKVAMALTAQNR